jgi:hypothetical protein
LVAVALVITAVALWPSSTPNKEAAPAPVATTIAPTTIETAGVPKYGHTETHDEMAVRVMKEYPEYYPTACKPYPPASEIKATDAVPFTNVIATLTYSSAKGIYVVASDPRMTVTYTVATEQGDNETYRIQKFTFTFAPGVRFFRAYDGGGGNGYWSSTPQVFAPSDHAGYTLALMLTKQSVKSESPVPVLATDTTGCSPSTVPLPSGFDWTRLAQNGLFIPEYAASHAGHPQG